MIIRKRKEMRRDEDCFVEVERDVNIFLDLCCLFSVLFHGVRISLSNLRCSVKLQ